MTTRLGARDGERGVALVLVLGVLIVTAMFGAISLRATHAAVGLTGELRLGDEAQLVAFSVVAEARLRYASQFAALLPGERRAFPDETRSDGWTTRVSASRRDSLVVVVASVARERLPGVPLAWRRAALLLLRGPADTLRVLRQRPMH